MGPREDMKLLYKFILKKKIIHDISYVRLSSKYEY